MIERDEEQASAQDPTDPRAEMLPPPVRRIRLDAQPTVALPPLTDAGVDADGRAPGASGLPARTARATPAGRERMTLKSLSVFYGDNEAVKQVSLAIREGEVLALIGPSGCGKTTLLRTLNRLTELTPSARRTGVIRIDGTDVDDIEVTTLRRRVSMVFQQPNPFPMSVFDNVAYALREQGAKRPKKKVLEPYVIEALRRAGLLDEVKDKLDHPALRLSGGQQQRLCIARALAAGPEVLLMDEPCSALDPKSTEVIEDLILELRQSLAVVIVTHNLQQAHRVGDNVAFMYLGDLVEYGPADQLFGNPVAERTRDYVRGAFG
ncbi:MAG TPA: phosphate ABC transporter ATP-binding protein [Solirubrobacteraceae bacterium]|nr:phosphate ABC transporter ATP-binding protein [Solirubrobacteraceae bacterium]